MGVVAVTGSASGIGLATRRRLEQQGQRVIGVDLRDAEVIADLSTADGRRAAIIAVRAAAGECLDGLVACAGVGPHVASLPLIVSLNYFGAQALIAGLRESLATSPQAAVVAISSNSSTLPGTDTPPVTACLDADEQEARRVAEELAAAQVYGGSKLALARWVRRNAPRAEWAGAGIRLNAVAPGAVRTPLLEGGLAHPQYGPAIRGFPIPTGDFGSPDQVAAVVTFLLSADAGFCCGSVFFVDGGSDALLRPGQF